MNGKVCADCKIEMYPKENGIFVVEYMNRNEPYKLWRADLWSCKGCGRNAVLGFATCSIVDHYEPQFKTVLDNIRASGKTIIDCYEHLEDVPQRV
jgi:hypothetical protein